MSLKSLLIDAKKIVQNGWCQRAFELPDYSSTFTWGSSWDTGLPIGKWSKYLYCPIGAMTKASKNKSYPDAHDAIKCFVEANEIKSIMCWNDDPDRTKEQVLDAFDKAIEYAETQENQKRPLGKTPPQSQD
jgi:hypothetical protein